MLGALSRLPSWELDHSEEDVRGWPLRDGAGNLLGTVDELIVDTETQYVSQVVLSDGRKFPAHDVLLGEGIVTLGGPDTRSTETTTRSAAAQPGEAHAPSPEPPPPPEPRASEAQVAAAPQAAAPREVRATERAPTQRVDENDLVIPIVNEELEVGKRVVERGGVRVQARMAELPAERSVRLRDERVTVERHPTNRTLSAAEAEARLRDGSFEVKARSEEPIVGKRVHVVEEVIITKSVTERTEVVRDTLRHTEAEVTELPAQTQVKEEPPAKE